MTPDVAAVINLLRIRHAPPEWATFAELQTHVNGHDRRLDFFAFNCFGSKRFLRIAYEIKLTRADFLRELADPRKRLPAERFANECYFVAPAGQIHPDELPEGWGLVERMNGAGGLKKKKQAAQRMTDTLPVEFVAAMARRVADPVPELPPIYWKYAGREIPADTLREFADGQVRRQAENTEMQAKETMRRALDFEKVYRTVERMFGAFALSDHARLEELLSGGAMARKVTRLSGFDFRRTAEKLTELADLLEKKP